MKVQVLGPGCPKCTTLAERAAEAAQALGIECEIEKVTQLADIMKFGVMTTPALVVDGEVRTVGNVPSVDDIKTMLS